MDPDVTFAFMCDESKHINDRATDAVNLLVWAAWRCDWMTIRSTSMTMKEIADLAQSIIFEALDQ